MGSWKFSLSPAGEKIKKLACKAQSKEKFDTSKLAKSVMLNCATEQNETSILVAVEKNGFLNSVFYESNLGSVV